MKHAFENQKKVYEISGDARELNSVRSEEKWIFFPNWTGSSFFAQTSTNWEPAAMKKRNPPRISLMYTLTVNTEKFRNVSERPGGGRRGREVSRLNQEKKYFCFSNRLFLTNKAD